MARDDRKVVYPIDPATTALVSVDIQVGFGRDSWEAVPHAEAAVRNFIRAAQAWREIGGLQEQIGGGGEIAFQLQIAGKFEPPVGNQIAGGQEQARGHF